MTGLLTKSTYQAYWYIGKKHLSICIIAFCLVSLASDSFSQSTTRLFRRLHIQHPEAPSMVTALLQDRMGFIWMGTRDGLYRFDGYDFEAFRHNPAGPNSLKSNDIKSLIEDRAGNIWIGSFGAVQRFDPASSCFYQPNLGKELLEKILKCTVFQVMEDKKGFIWIITDWLGAIRYDPRSHAVKTFQDLGKETMNLRDYGEETVTSMMNFTYGIVEDQAGEIWLSSYRGIHRFQADREKFVLVPFEVPTVNEEGNFLDNTPRSLVATGPGALWLSTYDGGIFQRNPDTGEWTGFQHHPTETESLSNNRVLGIYLDSKENLWAGTVSGGLNRFDSQRQAFVHYQNAPGEINSLSANHVYSILEDRNGLIWVGTTKGVDILRPQNAQFEFYQKETNVKNTLTSTAVTAFLEDRDGNLWIGTGKAGLNRYDPKTRIYESYRYSSTNPNSLGDDAVWSIVEDHKGRIWVATSKGLLNLFNPANGTFRRFTLPKIHLATFANQIRSMSEDEKGTIWLGTLGSGLYAFDPQTETFQRYRHEEGNDQSLSSNAVYVLQADQQGGLWVGTLNGGISHFDLEKQLFTSYKHESDNYPSYRSYQDIYALCVDRQQRVWIGTANARLGLYNPQTDDFKFFFANNTDASYVIISITDDAKGNLWLATENGLLHFTPPEDLYALNSEGTIQRYTLEDGLQDNDFFKIYQSQTGYIYAGGGQGFNRFHPDSLNRVIEDPNVVLTDFQIFNQSVPIGEGTDSLAEAFFLERHIAYLDQVVLKHWQRIFSVHFAATDYTDSRRNRFAYRLIGFNSDWTDIGRQHFVTFTNLNAGTYTLEIKATNSKGAWSERVRSLQLIIIPPWYQTRLAYLVFALLLAVTVYGIYHFNLNRRLRQEEARRAIEMSTLKSRLYTNITHEFRTPLTVITGLAEQLAAHRDREAGDVNLLHGLHLIQRNGQNLLRLINQLLDLAKLNSNKLNVSMIQGNVVSFLQYLTESFYSMAEEKEIDLTFNSEVETLVMDFDEEKLQQIIYNLLSNAIKFTQQKGQVNLHLRKLERSNSQLLQIRIKDTGIGITAKELPLIFERFYQVDDSSTRKREGTGIGLALTKDLVELLNGTIQVESQAGKGTIFTILLPIANQAVGINKRHTIPNTNRYFQYADKSAGSKIDAPILLIVEDNQDIVYYISNLLENEYVIHVANNGQTGVERAIELVPDIIISDVMMPEKNGYELCNMLKQDERTSHIPIILLTARATQEDRLEGLEQGADAYLTKPFQKHELLIRLKKLVELRKKLRANILNYDASKPPESIDNHLVNRENQFLLKLRKSIEGHLDDPDFSVHQLAESVFMSQMQVYRKLKALLDKTPSQFIRSIRLQKGKELVQSTDKTISEIAYDVGFSDPGYFSKMFKKEFKQSPKDLRD